MDNDYTIKDLASEMQSFVYVSPSIMALAGISNIMVGTNEDFKELVQKWSQGLYDDDPNMVVQELTRLLNNE